MAKHAWTLLCKRAIIDRDSLIPFVIEIVQVVTVSEEDIARGEDIAQGEGRSGYIEFPMQLFGLWARSDWAVPETVTLRLRILLPNGEYSTIQSTDEESFSISLLESPSIRPRIQIVGIPWAGLGVYWFSLEEYTNKKKWKQVATIPLELRRK